MSLDVEAERRLTPACRNGIFLNHAGASPSPDPVTDVVVGHLRREAEVGGYVAAAEASERVEAVYGSIAALVNGEPDEVALVESATAAWDAVFFAMRFEPGDRILTGRSEYVSNAIALLQVAERSGVVVDVIDDDEHGQISVEQLRQHLDERVKLVALTHVPTNGGLVNPAEAVGQITREAGAFFLLDVCQSVGQIDLDVERLGCDALTATGRKFLRGPRGTGFAWVRRARLNALEPLGLDSRSASWTSPTSFRPRSDARRFERWEHSVAARLGLGAAVDHALGIGLAQIEPRVGELAEHLRTGLTSLPGVTVHDKGEQRCGIVTFTVDGAAASELQAALAARAITTWTSTAEHAQFDMPHRGLTEVIRASVHYVNTTDELDQMVEAVAGLAPSH
jgi:cysteine desulfurase / selenocysteine lyase